MRKSYIAVLAAFVSLTVAVFYYGNASNVVEKTTVKTQIDKPTDISLNIEQKNMPIKKETISKEPETKKEEISILDKTSYIGRTRDSTQQFTVSLTTDKTLILPVTTQSEFAIPFRGQLESNGKVSDFAISLSERYMEYADFIQLEVLDQRTGKDVKCPIGFVGNLEKDTNYEIKLNYSADHLECQLVNAQPMSEQTLAMKKRMSQPIKLSDLPPELQKKFLENINK